MIVSADRSVRGRDGDAQARGQQDHQAGVELGGEGLGGQQRGHLLAHGAHHVDAVGGQT